jgi:hypothetical protein
LPCSRSSCAASAAFAPRLGGPGELRINLSLSTAAVHVRRHRHSRRACTHARRHALRKREFLSVSSNATCAVAATATSGRQGIFSEIVMPHSIHAERMVFQVSRMEREFGFRLTIGTCIGTSMAVRDLKENCLSETGALSTGASHFGKNGAGRAIPNGRPRCRAAPSAILNKAPVGDLVAVNTIPAARPAVLLTHTHPRRARRSGYRGNQCASNYHALSSSCFWINVHDRIRSLGWSCSTRASPLRARVANRID